MIERRGHKVTPKAAAAFIIDDWLDRMQDGWFESDHPVDPKQMTEREYKLVQAQLDKYQDRIVKLLGFDTVEVGGAKAP